MDLCSLSLCICVMMVCLPGAARVSSGDVKSCPCPEIPRVNFTLPPQDTCFKVGDHYRYTCIEGYKRKVGFSNLIKCKQTNDVPQWSKSVLRCIPDPLRTKPQPTTITVAAATSTTQITQSVSTSSSEVEQPQNTTEPATHEYLTQTAVETRTVQNSTLLLSTANSSVSSPASQSDAVKTTVVTVSTTVLVIVFGSLTGIFILVYRRRSEMEIPVHTAEEVTYMNSDPEGEEL